MPVRFTSGAVVKSLTTPDRHIGGREFELRQFRHNNQAVSRYRLTAFFVCDNTGTAIFLNLPLVSLI
jgi:hypothetical protein